MKQVLILLLLLTFFSTSFSQPKYLIDVGLARRIFPFLLEDDPPVTVVTKTYFSSVDQFRTNNVTLDFRRRVLNGKLDIGIATYFRYNHNHYERDSSYQQYREIKKLKADVFLETCYRISFGKEDHKKISIGLGYGLMNLNSNYDFSVVYFDNMGNHQVNRKHGAYQFGAARLSVGAELKKFKFTYNLHGTPDLDYNPNPTLWTDFKLSYNIFSF